MADPKSKDPPASREDFLQLFKRGQEFTEELLTENERLRYQVASLQEELDQIRRKMDAEGVVRDLMAQIKALESDRQRLLDHYRGVEQENRDYSSRYLEIEEAHNHLANLYVASYQMHGTLAFHESVQIISEILLNLIGAEEFAIYVLDEDTGTLHALLAEGRDLQEFAPMKLGEGKVGVAVAERQQMVADDATPGSVQDPMAIIPLAVGDRRVGAIVLLKLLVQKERFSALDHEIFSLLGAHAATAIIASAQHSAQSTKFTRAMYEQLWQRPAAAEGA